jgi:hypothetical protein
MGYINSFGRSKKNSNLTMEEVEEEIIKSRDKIIRLLDNYAEVSKLRAVETKLDNIGITSIFRTLRDSKHPDNRILSADIFIQREIGSLFRIYGKGKTFAKLGKNYELCEIPTDLSKDEVVRDIDHHFSMFDNDHELTTLNIKKIGDQLRLIILDEMNPNVEFHFDFLTFL